MYLMVQVLECITTSISRFQQVGVLKRSQAVAATKPAPARRWTLQVVRWSFGLPGSAIRPRLRRLSWKYYTPPWIFNLPYKIPWESAHCRQHSQQHDRHHNL